MPTRILRQALRSRPNHALRALAAPLALGLMSAAAAAAVPAVPAMADGAASQSASADKLTAYGQIRLTLNHLQSGADTRKELRDNASRFGVRGSETLGQGLTALFGLEMGLSADTGAFADPKVPYRNAYVALRHAGWGTLALGRLDSANPTGSPLYSQVTALTRFAPNDAGATAIGTSMLNARNRVSNAVGYQSPRWGGVDLRLRGYLRGAGTEAESEQSARSLDAGLNYTQGPLQLALGWGRDQRGGGLRANEFDGKWQLGGAWDAGGWSVYALAGQDRYRPGPHARRRVDYQLLGSSLKSGPHQWVLNLMWRDGASDRHGPRRRQQLGYQYRLSKRTELQAYLDHDGIDARKTGVALRAIGAGMRQDF